MRDKSFDKVRFVDQLERVFSGNNLRILELRNHVVNNPNFLADNYLVLPKSLKDILGLLLASWYIPQELGFVIREDIREYRLPSFSLTDQTLIELFLNGKATLEQYLFDTTLWHTRDFFGNFTETAKKVIDNLQTKRKNTKVIKPQRKRGYHDHGSVVPIHKWLPKSDYSLTNLQNQIEETRSTHEDTLQLIKGFLD